MEFYINETAGMGYCPYNILLDDTNELNSIADRIQKAKGELPLFDYTGDYDSENWYNFFLTCGKQGVDCLYFEYGMDGTYCDEIQLTDEDKVNAFNAVIDYFGSDEKYNEYIMEYEEAIA